uniref:Calcium uniporter protein C-terminal domain-containing protein n=1 Tax=Chromera velia CCMP2878 TaxID=1169474 RepID=A0A0G4F6E4_9ALVE|eukprot:Cvel_15297.t1-p1 / transcript=Cvel_15297.t1 / gene=Cvel_15297 / organism=Chromera_velia_CCMP2878 / gene_product=Calcium uniporter protein, mitochondrial, putative / transcript_product=Calcium uniporter protein, mitochondrial, putative / location=Cvel_scaffold1123:10869-12392(-) / protein_length=361 / sequence_SO=supercontig / SO=protein_coding / is_pseudo=false
MFALAPTRASVSGLLPCGRCLVPLASLGRLWPSINRRFGSLSTHSVNEAFFDLSRQKQNPLLTVSFGGAVTEFPIKLAEAPTVSALTSKIQANTSKESQVVVKTLDGIPVAESADLLRLSENGFTLEVNGVDIAVPPLCNALSDSRKEMPSSDFAALAKNAQGMPNPSVSSAIGESVSLVMPKDVEVEKAQMNETVECAIQKTHNELVCLLSENEAKLRSLLREEKSLSAQRAQLTEASRKGITFWAWTFVGVSATQFFIIAYGTYYIYSWDIMEPISYLMGVFDALCAWVFFTCTKRDFSAEGHRQHYIETRRERLARKMGYSSNAHELLQKKIAALEASCTSLRGQIEKIQGGPGGKEI